MINIKATAVHFKKNIQKLRIIKDQDLILEILISAKIFLLKTKVIKSCKMNLIQKYSFPTSTKGFKHRSQNEFLIKFLKTIFEIKIIRSQCLKPIGTT